MGAVRFPQVANGCTNTSQPFPSTIHRLSQFFRLYLTPLPPVLLT
jgi:hypothetical protein